MRQGEIKAFCVASLCSISHRLLDFKCRYNTTVSKHCRDFFADLKKHLICACKVVSATRWN